MERYEQLTNIIKNNDLVDIEVATEPKMNKTNNPYYGRVKKHTAYLGVDFGKSYTKEVNRRRAEEGKTADFQAKKSPYERVNDYFVRKGEQIYLQMLLKKDNKTKCIYEVDNRPATEEEITAIKGFMPSKSKATNQGLNEGNEVQMRVIKIENIVAIGNSEKTYTM